MRSIPWRPRREPGFFASESECRDNSEIVVSVTDTGKGIGSEDNERIFNPLFTTKSGGMGMGLSICRSIIEAHDGRLWVASNSPKGAVFHFALSLEMINDAREYGSV